MEKIEELAKVGGEYLVIEMDKLYYQIKKTIESCSKKMNAENLNEAVENFIKYKSLRRKAVKCGILESEPLLHNNDDKIRELIKPYKSFSSSLTFN